MSDDSTKEQLNKLIEDVVSDNDVSRAERPTMLPGTADTSNDIFEDLAVQKENQNLEFRKQILTSINAGRESRQKARNGVMKFYAGYLIVVTIGIFWILIDPMNHHYSRIVDELLIGTLLVNLISLSAVIVKYAFSSEIEKILIQLFDKTNDN